MPLLDHLREFRNRFLKSLLAIFLASIAGSSALLSSFFGDASPPAEAAKEPVSSQAT
jgi:Sec-independent protein secretion pathway component TatC